MKKIQLVFQRYEGAKALLGALWGIAGAATLAICAFSIIKEDSVSPATFTKYTLQYNLEYWAHNWGMLGAAISVYIGIFTLDIGRPFFHRYVKRSVAGRRKQISTARLQRMAGAFAAIGLGGILIGAPLIGLKHAPWVQLLVLYAPAPLTIAYYTRLLVKFPGEFKPLQSLSSETFDSRPFSTATLGVPSSKVRQELRDLAEVSPGGPASEGIKSYIEKGGNGLWKGNDEFLRRLGELLCVGPEDITLHSTGTAAIKFAINDAIAIVREDHPIAKIKTLCSDADYGTVQRSLKDAEKNNELRLGLAKVESLLWNSADDHDIVAAYLEAAKALPPKSSKIRILMLLHVHNWTGRRLPVKRIVSQLREQNLLANDALLICDGAQAIGNIEHPSEVIELCQYYASCGHKWLLGKATLGILIRQGRVEGGIGPLRNSLDRGLSVYKPDPAEEANRSTIDLDPHVSLNAMLPEFKEPGMAAIAEHNFQLGKTFISNARDAGLPMSFLPHLDGGLVAFTLNTPEPEIARLEREFGITPAVGAKGYRVCFHFFHSESDVFDLLEALDEAFDGTDKQR